MEDSIREEDERQDIVVVVDCPDINGNAGEEGDGFIDGDVLEFRERLTNSEANSPRAGSVTTHEAVELHSV
eukprot:TRINITY_DN13381_c0_g1_i1.p2 TRINITY_DN13381_c0_g1~~TRINITY_DN13381_c0_g1_i1.p2  ORF type:complete len:71 (-),score=14.93 TRINITY_DN13381_c0_g1_i1:515-727(-)